MNFDFKSEVISIEWQIRNNFHYILINELLDLFIVNYDAIGISLHKIHHIVMKYRKRRLLLNINSNVLQSFFLCL